MIYLIYQKVVLITLNCDLSLLQVDKRTSSSYKIHEFYFVNWRSLGQVTLRSVDILYTVSMYTVTVSAADHNTVLQTRPKWWQCTRSSYQYLPLFLPGSTLNCQYLGHLGETGLKGCFTDITKSSSSCRDPETEYKYVGDTISAKLLFGSILVPVILIVSQKKFILLGFHETRQDICHGTEQ